MINKKVIFIAFILHSRPMKYIVYFIGFTFLILPWCIPRLHCNLLEVAIDGNQDYTSIQTAINESINGDTVLVYPGIYHENIDFLGKSFSLGSLTLTTGDDSYISQTIIDGNQNGTCIFIEESENVMICGFTIRNGSGFPDDYFLISEGGGLYIMDSSVILRKNIINNNIADYGGGLLIGTSSVFLYDNSIKNNLSRFMGGGIFVYATQLEFSTSLLNSVFMNHAASGNDIIGVNINPFEVILDTCTVINPDKNFVKNMDEIHDPIDFTLEIQNGFLNTVDADLYVSTNGIDDDNRGLTPDEPLQTLTYALKKIKADSLNPNTIHVSNGIYSSSLNNQLFPINVRGNIRIIGESMDNTIFDGEDKTLMFVLLDQEKNVDIKNINILNGYECDIFNNPGLVAYKNNSMNLDNIKITGCSGFKAPTAFFLQNTIDARINNLYIEDNYGNSHLSVHKSKLYGTNIRIRNNHPGGIAHGTNFSISHGNIENRDVVLINLESSDNILDPPPGSTNACNSSIQTVDAYLINATLAYNYNPTEEGGQFAVGHYADVKIYNSIFYSDNNREINMFCNSGPIDLAISHSLIKGGQDNIGYIPPHHANLVWQEGNIDQNPMFNLTSNEHPYSLTSESPCIDAGTLDLPEGIELPETDLAGNPRVYGETIDMGAYEYQEVSVQEPEAEAVDFDINVYPNPVIFDNDKSNCKIWFEVPKAGNIEIAIFNLKGQKIKTFSKVYRVKGSEKLIWNGKDDYNKQVPSGNYFIRIEQNGAVKTRKMILLK